MGFAGRCLHRFVALEGARTFTCFANHGPSYLAIWLSGYLAIWLSGYLAIWLSLHARLRNRRFLVLSLSLSLSSIGLPWRHQRLDACIGRPEFPVVRPDFRRTKNFRAVQMFMGHTTSESTVRHPGIEVADALEIAEQTDI
jgi:hypothetical protein